MSEDENQALGVGLDMGTMNIVAARRTAEGVTTNRIRDAFLDLPDEHRKMLKLSGVNYVQTADGLVIVGDAAYDMANMFSREVRRPLQSGLIAAGEIDALEILGILVKHVLGKPVEENEVCYFSVPAAPVDDPDRDVIYHRGILEKIVTECGFKAYPSNEALAIIYSECAKDGFSGIGMSFGCLTPETRIFVRRERSEGPMMDYIPVEEVLEGDFVLGRKGAFNRVQKTWVRPHSGPVYRLSFYGNPDGVVLTGNHEVWVNRDQQWEWRRADELEPGDVVGEPVAVGHPRGTNLNFTEKVTNAPAQKKHIAWSMGLGRFLGYFLADGHLGPEDRGTIWFDFGPEEQSYVEDVRGLLDHYFNRSATVTAHGNAHRVQFGHTGLWAWLNRRCYGPSYWDEKTEKTRRDKIFPLRIEDLNASIVEGIVVGLFRGDGHVAEASICTFSNTSTSLVAACHLLLRRMGLVSTMNRRDPRGSTFADGRQISADRCKDEWTVHVCGSDAEWLESLVAGDGVEKRTPKVWREGGMVCTRLRSVEEVPYEGSVHDLTVEGDPSFCAPGITLHNSGMTNVALAMGTIEGISFSVARGGDWIDHGAAKSTGSTQARICTLKEKGLKLTDPKSREEEALVVYYKNLIEYAIDNVASEFNKIKDKFALPKAIPIVVSGGTSKAGGFLDFFTQVFESKRKKFPIEISEIRAAKEPLDAVARGLLVQALQEYDDED